MTVFYCYLFLFRFIHFVAFYDSTIRGSFWYFSLLSWIVFSYCCSIEVVRVMRVAVSRWSNPRSSHCTNVQVLVPVKILAMDDRESPLNCQKNIKWFLSRIEHFNSVVPFQIDALASHKQKIHQVRKFHFWHLISTYLVINISAHLNVIGV